MPEPVLFIRPDGGTEWHLNGLRHRLDGPARTWPDGVEAWYNNGVPHRLDGPAYVGANGEPQWWVLGDKIPFDIIAFFKDMGVEDADDETKLAVLKMKMAAYG